MRVEEDRLVKYLTMLIILEITRVFVLLQLRPTERIGGI